ncbi:MAG: hypothetical protein H5T64_00455 [Chloroflexi bacterium]|nr:hypothetical protein [Chloroflexota bacterium]
MNEGRRHLVALTIFIALTLVMTYPLGLRIGNAILGVPVPGDGYEYMYKCWWLKHALLDEHISPLYNPDVFYPFGYGFEMSEGTLANTLWALPFTLMFGEVAAYNLVMLWSFVLSGFTAYLLVFQMTRSGMAGLLAGVVFAFLPYRMVHLGLGQVPMMSTGWMPLCFLYLRWGIREDKTRWGIMAGLMYALTALSSWYYAYILGLFAGLYVLWRGRLRQRECWQWVASFVVVAILMVGPFAWRLAGLSEQLGGRRYSLSYVDQWSAGLLEFVLPANAYHPIWGSAFRPFFRYETQSIVYLGLVSLALAGVALRARWRDRGVRDFAVLGAVAVVLALGTTLHILRERLYVSVPAGVERLFTAGMSVLTKQLALNPISSYVLRVPGALYIPLPTLLLYLFMPSFNLMRVWARFGVIAGLSVAVLAGVGLASLLERVTRGRWLVAVVAIGMVLIDFAVLPYPLGWCEVRAQTTAQWLAAQDGDFVVMRLPTHYALRGSSLYDTITHGKRIAYGYGTFFPQGFEEERETLDSFPSPESLEVMRGWDVRYVLVGSQAFGKRWPEIEHALDVADLRLAAIVDEQPVYHDDRLLKTRPGYEEAFLVDRVYIYELLPQ